MLLSRLRVPVVELYESPSVLGLHLADPIGFADLEVFLDPVLAEAVLDLLDDFLQQTQPHWTSNSSRRWPYLGLGQRHLYGHQWWLVVVVVDFD